MSEALAASSYTLEADPNEVESFDDSYSNMDDQRRNENDEIAAFLGEQSWESYEQTMSQLEAYFGNRVFTFKTYIGTIADMSACPMFAFKVEQGFEAARDWLLEHDGQGIEEDDDTLDKDENDSDTDEPQSAPQTPNEPEAVSPGEKPIADTKKPVPELVSKETSKTLLDLPDIDTSPLAVAPIASSEGGSEQPIQDIVSENEMKESPRHKAPGTGEQTSAELSSDLTSREEVLVGSREGDRDPSLDSFVSESDAVMETTSRTINEVSDASISDVVEVPENRPDDQSNQLPETTELEIFPEVESVIENEVDDTTNGEVADKESVLSTELVSVKESANTIEQPVDVGAATQEIVDEAQELYAPWVAEEEPTDETAPDVLPVLEPDPSRASDEHEAPSAETTKEALLHEMVREILAESDAVDNTDETMFERVLDTETDDKDEDPSLLNEIVDELKQPQPLEEDVVIFLSELVGEAPLPRAEWDEAAPIQIIQQSAKVVYRINRLSAATTANECREELDHLRVELVNLLRLIGYIHPEQIAEELIRRYDVVSLRKYMQLLIRNITLSQSVKVQNAHASTESMLMSYHYGSRAVRMTVSLAA